MIKFELINKKLNQPIIYLHQSASEIYMQLGKRKQREYDNPPPPLRLTPPPPPFQHLNLKDVAEILFYSESLGIPLPTTSLKITQVLNYQKRAFFNRKQVFLNWFPKMTVVIRSTMHSTNWKHNLGNNLSCWRHLRI